MKKNLRLFCIIILLSGQTVIAQENTDYEFANKNSTYMGLGLGLTYGGIGGRFVYNPSKNIGMLLGLGYNLVGIGYNVGLMYYLPSEKRTQAYISGMVGYNSVIKVEGASQFDESYFGPSFGFGMILKSRGTPKGYWDFGLIIPVRSTKFKDDWDMVKNNPSIEVQNDPLPILINIGYNFQLD